MPNQQLISALGKLINAETKAERKRILESEPDLLLTDDAEELLSDWLAQSQGDQTRILQECRTLLIDCRQKSRETAFLEFLHSAPILNALLKCDRATDLLALVEQHPELLSDEMVLLLYDTTTYRHDDAEDEAIASHVEKCLIILRPLREMMRQTGMSAREAVRAYSLLQEQILQATNVAVKEFISADSWVESKRIVIAKRDLLLTNLADQAFRNLLKQHKNDSDTTRTLQEHRQLLTRCRREGIEAAFVAFVERLRLDKFVALWEEIQALTDPTDMPRRVKLCRHALTLGEQQTTFWALLQFELGNSLQHNPHGNRTDNLEQAIHHYKQALEVFTQQAFPDHWVATIMNLGLAYSDRIRGERAQNIEQVISYYEQALEVKTRQAFPIEWAQIMNDLAIAYRNRILGDPADNLEKAISYYLQVLEVRTPEAFPVKWANTINNLAVAYKNRILGDRADNLERAISHYLQALEVRTRQALPVEWADTINNLANAYSNRILGDRVDNLERALGYYSQTLEVRTQQAFPVKWARTMNGLGLTYSERIKGERTENLEQAIWHYKQALEVQTCETLPIEWAQTMNNLANAYLDRIKGEPADNIEEAISYYRQALEIRRRQVLPYDWAETMNNLGNAYSKRLYGDEADNIEQAIQCYSDALMVTTQEAFPIEWAQTTSNLGLAYSKRLKGEPADNIEQAISYLEQALKIRTQQAFPIEWAETMNNLANAYKDRIRGERADNLERAIAANQKALEIYTLSTMPHEHRMAQWNLGGLYFREGHWADAYTAYAAALKVNDLLYQASGTTEARQSELRELRLLNTQAAYCLAKLGRLEEAVTTLEQGKARTLAEALTRQEAVLERATEEDEATFTAARLRIRELEAEARAIGQQDVGRFLAISADLRRAREELSAAVARIREYVPDFMPEGLDFAGIYSVAEALNQPLIYLLSSSPGSLALVVPPAQSEKVVAVWRDELPIDDLVKILSQENAPAYLHGTVGGDTKALKAVLDEIWPLLNDKLMRPITTRLADLGYQQAVLIPTGALSLLPLHVLVPQVNFTLASSARALQTAKERLDKRAHLSASLLGIGNPLPNPKPLPFARLEVEEIAPLFGEKLTFYEKQALRTNILSALLGTTHLHFSCHGTFNPISPLDSALYLAGDDTLTLRDMLDGGLDLSSARLAVLSACQTGITDFLNVPDEAIGFPAGFLQAGVPGVISTLWPVMDISTALLMGRFYQNHLKNGMAAASALHEAQQWLRQLAIGEVVSYIEKWSQMGKHKNNAQLLMLKNYYSHRAQQNPSERPFDHPYYWAAFVFSGV